MAFLELTLMWHFTVGTHELRNLQLGLRTWSLLLIDIILTSCGLQGVAVSSAKQVISILFYLSRNKQHFSGITAFWNSVHVCCVIRNLMLHYIEYLITPVTQKVIMRMFTAFQCYILLTQGYKFAYFPIYSQ
jgi:hypothetical protein